MTAFEKLETELKLRAFSPRTVQSYIFYNKKFLDFTKKEPEDMTEDDVRSYIADLMSRGISPKSIILIKAALRFFYVEVLRKGIVNIKTPKIAKRLPVVLTKEEVRKLIDSVENEKHRLIVSFLYSSGLRLSELVNLKVGDVELNERIGWVRSGKGLKDRMFTLPNVLVEDLRRRFKEKSESDYVFDVNRRRMSPRNVQKIVSSAAKNAGLGKPVHVHTLRHSFATHLLESGTNIRKIQVLLGHNSLETTQIYTQVSPEEIKKIKNPLDEL